jgi:hypothetical protein
MPKLINSYSQLAHLARFTSGSGRFSCGLGGSPFCGRRRLDVAGIGGEWTSPGLNRFGELEVLLRARDPGDGEGRWGDGGGCPVKPPSCEAGNPRRDMFLRGIPSRGSLIAPPVA